MIITRNKASSVAMISLEDYEALQPIFCAHLRMPAVGWNPLSSLSKMVISKTNFMKTAAPGLAPALLSYMAKQIDD
jgi:hypothetical protein|nr:hypothetical protein [Halomonas sp. UBA3074]|tara:strand:+ start:1127 stop:1354 length:228 start_codon:yes stop_codon:yes gene_type:complete